MFWKLLCCQLYSSTPLPRRQEYRYEILSADEGDKEKLQQFYDACDGITQAVKTDPTPILDSSPTSSSLAPSELLAPSVDDVELAMAINASIQSVIAEGVPNVQPTASTANMNDRGDPASNSLYGRWHPPDAPGPSLISRQAQVDTPSSSTYNRRRGVPGTGCNQCSSRPDLELCQSWRMRC